jgi:hypothetical protein
MDILRRNGYPSEPSLCGRLAVVLRKIGRRTTLVAEADLSAGPFHLRLGEHAIRLRGRVPAREHDPEDASLRNRRPGRGQDSPLCLGGDSGRILQDMPSVGALQI